MTKFERLCLSGFVGKRIQLRVLTKKLVENSDSEITARVSLAKWFVQHQPIEVEIQKTKQLSSDMYWSYWHSAIDESPAIVKASLASQQFFLGEKHVLLSDENLNDYLILPAWIHDKRRGFSTTHFSDLLRLLLLRTYGGVWMDATVLLTAEPGGWLPKSKFFAFSRPSDPFLLSNWFLAADSDTYIVKQLLSGLCAYWRDHEEQSHYFNFHFLFELFFFTDAVFRRQWIQSVEMSHVAPHILQAVLHEEFVLNLHDDIRAKSHVHKLTYKVDIEIETDKTNFFSYLVRSHKQ